VPDRDDVVRADEQVRLAVVDPAGGGIQMRRAQHDEEGIAVALELRPLVRPGGVLDRHLLDLGEHLLVRLARPSQTNRSGSLRTSLMSGIDTSPIRRPAA